MRPEGRPRAATATLALHAEACAASPGWSWRGIVGANRANPTVSRRARAGCIGTSRHARCRTYRSAPLQRTRRFQGFSPLTNPLRPTAVSSGRSLAPPMGFVPLQGSLRPPTATSSRRGPTAHQQAGVDRSGPRGAVANHGGAALRSSHRRFPCIASRHGQCASRCNASNLVPQGRLFSVERGFLRALPWADRRGGDEHGSSISGVCPVVGSAECGSRDALTGSAARGRLRGESPAGQLHRPSWGF